MFRDLALRNILFAYDLGQLVAKVSDFGLSKILSEENNYYKQSNDSAVAIKVKSYYYFFKLII